MKRILALAALCFCSRAFGQSLGNAGTLQGTVTDPSGAPLPGVSVSILNRLTNYKQAANTDSTGTFRFNNIPPNPYHLEATASNFAPYGREVEIRGAVPIDIKIQVALAGTQTTVTVADTDLL